MVPPSLVDSHAGESGALGTIVMIAGLATLVVGVVHAALTGSGHLDREPTADERADVTVLRIALDAAAIAALELDRTDERAADRLIRICRALRGVRAAWRWGGAIDFEMMRAGEAHRVAERYVVEARLRGRDDGAELALVTIVVAAAQELFTVARVRDGEELRAALEALSSAHALDVRSVDVVVTPTTSAALARAYAHELIAIVR